MPLNSNVSHDFLRITIKCIHLQCHTLAQAGFGLFLDKIIIVIMSKKKFILKFYLIYVLYKIDS